ncbi:hypothetical protein FRC07_003755 [Ceratobasidium sp. 392]|nr:hypothetical protein FRC07_003755 [Ceratobasidium sp. 392]
MATIDDRPSAYCDSVTLSTGQVVGLSFAAQAGFISAIAVVILLSMVAYKYWENIRHPPGPPWRLIRTNIDAFMLNLLIADFIMSLGAILDIKWANERRTYCGSYCNAQGAIQIVGETAVALFTFTITLYTFISVVRGKVIKCRVLLWGSITLVIWLFVLLWAVLGYATHPKSGNDSFYAPTPYWCWISQNYTDERLAGEYVWLWFAGFGNLLLYIPLFFILRGNIVWDEDEGWRSLTWKRLSLRSYRSRDGLVGPNDTESALSRKDNSGNPKQFLWYPFAYTIVVLPMSIVRWITFNDKGEPSPAASTATAVAVSIFNLSGVINVILILATRTNVLLFGSRGVIPVPNVPEEESPQVQESETNVGVLAGDGRRRWFRNSAGGLGSAVGHPSSEVEAEDTGFGGPRVRLAREDDEESLSVGGPKFEGSSTGRANSGNSPPSGLGLHSNLGTLPGIQMQSARSANITVRETAEVHAPGRAYLESLGARSARNLG